MSSFVEEFTEDIEKLTQYCDIRDLLSAWREHKIEGLAKLEPILAEFPDICDRIMVLEGRGLEMTYLTVGWRVTDLFGYDPKGKRLADLDNPAARRFSEIYHRVMDDGSPSFCIHRRAGPSTTGVTERLILPIRIRDRPGLLVYLRSLEAGADLMRSVFQASTDSITILEAVRDAAAQIVDFRIQAINAEAARRMQQHPQALIDRLFHEVWPFARDAGIFARLVRAVEKQSADMFDCSYSVPDGRIAERRLHLVPFGDHLTVTNIDLSPVLTARRAIENQRNELLAANTLLESRAKDLKASNDALEQTMRELREEIRRNKILESELVHLARYDGLTGMPNRSFFESRFEEVMTSAALEKRRLALCFVDVDHFKEINDRFGHTTGDSVLKEVAGRLSQVLHGDDLIGRMGGDEFAVLLTNLADDEAAHAVVERMVETGTAPFTVNRQDVPISISVGVALYPADGTTTRDLMAAADMAVYRAKRDGRGRPAFFEPAMRLQAERLYRLIGRVLAAIENGEIKPHYQPLMDLRTGQLIGFEALARWKYPGRGLLGPSSFAEALDFPEVAQALTWSMIDAVIDDLSAWRGTRIPAHVSINVTSFDLKRPDFAAELNRRLLARHLSTRQLAIEVTETTVLSRDSERIGETLSELRGLGFSVALDDFGTGFASMSHLLQLPVDSLKIDRTFIVDLETSPKTAAVVRTLVALAAALDLDIVAEGVETRPQLDMLREMGCQIIQGYLIAQAMPACDVPGFMEGFGQLPGGRRGLAHSIR